MQGGACVRVVAKLHVAGGLAALALSIGACGGDDEKPRANATATQAQTQTERARTAPARPKRSPPPKVPVEVAGDVTAVREALEAADFTVEVSRGSGRSLAQLQVGDALVTFYRSSGDASKEAGALKKVLAGGGGEGTVRASGKRLYISGAKSDERFAKIVSTAEGAL